jgi:hypothetical protein
VKYFAVLVSLTLLGCIHVPSRPPSDPVLAYACEQTRIEHNRLSIAGIVFGAASGASGLAADVPTTTGKATVVATGAAFAIMGTILGTIAGLEADQFVQGHCTETGN